jgi:hypothetical protein
MFVPTWQVTWCASGMALGLIETGRMANRGLGCK